ncbi:MAG: hypothetical protein MJA83_12240 [Gammaproteobacteria bacterium]|nr:hypothetical protein [Gammaproteobacteria bacterium]
MDDKFAMERYLTGNMTPEEQAAFEQRYLYDTALLDELENADRLGTAFKRAAGQGVVTRAPQNTIARGDWMKPFAMAASVLLAVTVIVAGLTYQTLLSEKEKNSLLTAELNRILAPKGNTLILPISAVRSGGLSDSPDYAVSLADETSWLVLSVDTGIQAYDSFAVKVSDESGEVWQQDALLPDAFGALNISIHSSRLEDGVYKLEVTGTGTGADDEATIIARSSIRVRKEKLREGTGTL